MIGSTISHYTILEKLGEGGMGVVYKAHDTKLDRTVALKFLPAHLASSEQDKARFVQEAKAAAALNHPNVCSIIDIQQNDGQMFIVMEFVDGQTLREKQGTVSFKQAIDIGIQIADGLAAAHEKGIVHRDIKPENIMIRKDGIAQIMDFGLAKLRASGSKISRLTKEGSTVGTAGYMSPEQVQGLDTDHRSDIFSYGVLLYELLTGQLPFKGVHETALAYEIVNVDPPPLSSVKPDIDPNLDAIVLECLEKDVNERAQGIKQISVDLKRYKRESSRQRVSRVTAARPAIKATQSREASDVTVPGSVGVSLFDRTGVQWLFVVAGLIAGVLIGAGIMRWAVPQPNVSLHTDAPILRATINLPIEAPLALGSDIPTVGYNSPVVALSPDGAWLSYVAKTASGQMLYIRDMSSGDLRPLSGTEDATHPFFSPDGQWIGFLTVDHVKKVAREGGTVISLCEATTPVLAWWIQPNLIYFTEVETSILSRVSADGGKPEKVLSTADAKVKRLIDVLPDGQTVLADRSGSIGGDFGDIVRFNLHTLETKLLVRSGYGARYVPPGYVLFARAGSLMAVRFDLDRRETVGEPVAIASGVTMESLFGMLHASSSSNGIVAYPPGADLSVGKLAWIDRGGTVEYIDVPERVYGVVDLAPAGNRLAVHVGDVKDYIWIWDFARREGRRIANQSPEGFPLWSPDGRRLAGATAETPYRVILHNIERSGAIGEGQTIERIGRPASWSQQGDLLALSLFAPRRIEFLGVSKPVNAPGLDGFFPAFSPDGRWLAFNSTQTGANEVFIRSYPEGKVIGQVSSGGGMEPRWKPSGELFYRNGHRWFSTHVSTNPEPRWDPPRLVFDTDFIDTPGISYDVSKDGQRLLVVKRTRQVSQSRIEILANWFEILERGR